MGASTRRVAAAALAMSLGVLALAGCGGGQAGAQGSPVADVSVSGSGSGGLSGVVLDEPYDASHTSLRSTTGGSADLASGSRTPLTLVFFGYTHCPDVCTVVMATIASALTRLPAAEQQQVGMVFVSTDPARDTVPVLRRYLSRYNPAFVGLTGSLSRVVTLGKSLHVLVEKGQRLPSGGYEVTHGTQVLGLRPGGSAPILWTESVSPSQLADDLSRVLAGEVPGLRPGTAGGS